MIWLKNIQMSYPLEQSRVTVLKDVNLNIQAGESVAVVGPSGSGKTTLLLLLAGLDSPEDGNIEILGTRLDALSADELADLRRDRMGIVFQSFHLIPSLTALGNAALPLQIAGDADADAKAREILSRVGLAHRESHYPMQLSGGEQQRVAIARALVHSPPLILADEPTGNLDKDTGMATSDLLFELHDTLGSTLVLVTHDNALAARCDRQLRLDGGCLVEGPVHALPA
ncbi:MAG: ABC transporter ATP-binding protein [Gammaproteobacteria bacterium]|jgi:putative ABC transport system ATP-binding protein|nr:ABC transporter ATP-binding protein [Gammaproteobacteria bacterium]